MKTPISARVSLDVVAAAKARAGQDGVSLSVVVERALSEYLNATDEPSQPAAKPEWAIALEARIEALESQQQQSPASRKGKRRR